MIINNYFKLKPAAWLGCWLLIYACSGCIKEVEPVTEVRNDKGVLTSKEYLWKTDVSGKGYIWPALTPAVYENTVIMAGATSQEKEIIVALDIDTGEEVWRWNDYFSPSGLRNLVSSEWGYNQKDNVWLLQNGRFFYAIDLQNGSTIWKEERNGFDGLSGIQIIGNHYYNSFAFYEDTIQVPTLIRGDVYSQDYTKLVEPPIDTIQYFPHFYGTMGKPYVYEENGQLHAFLQFSENVDLYSSKSFNYVASYNLSTNSYDFEKTRLDDTVSLPLHGRPVMYQDMMIVNPDGELFGVEKLSGKVVWNRNDFQKNGDGVMTFALHEDRLFAVNTIGSTSRVMALDPMTGRTIWEDIGQGNAAHSLHFLNGVLYFSSRGDGHVYAYDTDTGELLWRLGSPEYDHFKGYGGFRVIPGKDGEKGKIIACTSLNAYCFEAER